MFGTPGSIQGRFDHLNSPKNSSKQPLSATDKRNFGQHTITVQAKFYAADPKLDPTRFEGRIMDERQHG
jgi:hypothetical protein